MAYLRSEKETIEVSYNINKIWETIPKALEKLEWKISEIDENKHQIKLKTTGAFLSYSSDLFIDLSRVDEKTTRMTVKAETPVTTITSVLDFGRTRDRIELFIGILAQLLDNKIS